MIYRKKGPQTYGPFFRNVLNIRKLRRAYNGRILPFGGKTKIWEMEQLPYMKRTKLNEMSSVTMKKRRCLMSDSVFRIRQSAPMKMNGPRLDDKSLNHCKSQLENCRILLFLTNSSSIT